MVATDVLRDLGRQTYASEFARSLGLDPDNWQREVLDGNHHRLILCCARQTGKSTTTGALALHRAMYHAGSLVLLLSPSLRQSMELFRKTTTFLSSMDPAPGISSMTKTSMDLENGSRIISLPGSESTIRGYSAPDLIVLDEAAMVSEDLYPALRPMLATRPEATIVLLSTPHGRRGMFFEVWEKGGPEWKKIRITAEECPRISAAFLEEERRNLIPRWYRQEYEVSFEEPAGAMFSPELIAKMLGKDTEPLFKGLVSADVEPLFRRAE